MGKKNFTCCNIYLPLVVVILALNSVVDFSFSDFWGSIDVSAPIATIIQMHANNAPLRFIVEDCSVLFGLWPPPASKAAIELLPQLTATDIYPDSHSHAEEIAAQQDSRVTEYQWRGDNPVKAYISGWTTGSRDFNTGSDPLENLRALA
jgi:hypothetical protein